MFFHVEMKTWNCLFSPNMPKIVLFDVDGVLIREGEMFSRRYCRDFHLSIEKMLPFFHGIFQECMLGRADLKQILHQYVAEWGWQRSIDELLEYWFGAENDVDATVLETVATLRKNGIRSFIATNNEKYRVMYLWERLGFRNHFDGVFSSSGVGVKKPAPEFFESVSQSLAAYSKQEILLCDNEPQNIDAARQYGFQTHLFTDTINFRREFADLL